MVENFEEITKTLTPDEEMMLPVIMRGLKAHSYADPIKGPDIVIAVNSQKQKYGFRLNLNEARLRKIVNHIRVNALLPVMATSSGYYVSDDPETIESQVRSLVDRAEGIRAAARGLATFLPKPSQLNLKL